MGTQLENSSNNSSRVYTLFEIFKTMSYGASVEDLSTLNAWLSKHGNEFGFFVDNKFDKNLNFSSLKYTFNSVHVAFYTFNGLEEMHNVIPKASRSWQQVCDFERSKLFYSITRSVQKHSSLFPILEALSSKILARESREFSLPYLIQTLYYYAGRHQDKILKNWIPVGTVLVYIPDILPLFRLATSVVPALAAGNIVNIICSPLSSLCAFYFAEICAGAGLPAGALSVGVLNYEEFEENLNVCIFPSVTRDPLLFGLSSGKVSRWNNSAMVYDSADIDSSIEFVMRGLCFGSGKLPWSISRLLVQESVYDSFISKLKRRLQNLIISDSFLDKNCDFYGHSEVSGEQFDGTRSESTKSPSKKLVDAINEAKKDGAEIFMPKLVPNEIFPPVLITEVSTSSNFFQKNYRGPILLAMPFRTVKESILLANNTTFTFCASIFAEKISCAMEVARAVKASTIWINGFNIFNPSLPFENMSNFLLPNLKYLPECDQKETIESKVNVNNSSSSEPYAIDRTFKLFYGGTQKRPDSGQYKKLLDLSGYPFVEVPISNKKDIRNAVEAAQKGFPSWKDKTPFNRSQILYYLAENLSQRRQEFVDHLSKIRTVETDRNEKELDSCIERIFFWASRSCQTSSNSNHQTTKDRTAVRILEPHGVVGIICPQTEFPLLGLMSLILPAISMGNVVVVIPSEQYSSVGLALHQVFETSDFPAGVFNILSGSQSSLATFLAEHQDVQAIWYFGGADYSSTIKSVTKYSNKFVWDSDGKIPDFYSSDDILDEFFVRIATRVKTIWIPHGETFAN